MKINDINKLISALGFIPMDGEKDIYIKKYPQHNDYAIKVDFNKKKIEYIDSSVKKEQAINVENDTSSNFFQSENLVVLECVNRLLEKGYRPENLILEKTWPAGHGTSGRLDICVTNSDKTEYLLIECKTYGLEFDKEFAKMEKNGGQLFTYFKFTNKANIIMLYASDLQSDEIIYQNEIVKIEDDYRSGGVADFYDKWNKLTKTNGVFDEWVRPYDFKSKALTINDLTEIKPSDSSFIFNQFLEILRHNVVSDKSNAFNKIFTLFLCKIYDEKDKEGTDEELEFQWLEGVDTHTTFQLRLADLYKNGMKTFLEKDVTDFSESEFDTQYKKLFDNDDVLSRKLKEEINRLRLEKNNEFAIKEVYDKKSFEENAKVVKEVAELLQKFKIRYAQKQQYLSDFFELLLTTGLKQESGQFFTPVPIAQFIIKSLPIDNFLNDKLRLRKRGNFLPYIIDYAAGSGHFITESMHEIQKLINTKDRKQFSGETQKFIGHSQDCPYDWAENYIYGIEKDYRLVKVGKVGCYLHGDGLAQVIHSDGLANFGHPEYKEKLSIKDSNFPKENKQFDVLVSNPPYSVSAFKNTSRDYYGEADFELYDSLTDSSSEIECLFIERMSQLLKDDGVAGVILPSSILNNEGIYTKAREIILKNFSVIGITELGSNTFMATGTNTVVLFLRRRNNYCSINLQVDIEKFFKTLQEVTIKKIEQPVSKYVNYVWENLTFDDYVTMLKKEPNDAVKSHEIYKEYKQKIKSKNDPEFWDKVIELEKEKLHYYILAHGQKVVLVKTGNKNTEKQFLGYEFSNRRGSEGIHPIQRGKTITECTKLFDEELFDNEEKASTYIYKAFSGDVDFPIHESLKENISRIDLIDMLTFNRANFAKNISTTVKKKIKIESKFQQVELNDIIRIQNGYAFKSSEYTTSGIRVIRIKNVQKGILQDNDPVFISKNRESEFENFILKKDDILVSMTGNPGRIGMVQPNHLPALLNQRVGKVEFLGNQVLQKYVFHILNTDYFEEAVLSLSKGIAQLNVSSTQIESIKIPLPPLEIQERMVKEIEVLEQEEVKAKEDIEKYEVIIMEKVNQCYSDYKLQQLGFVCDAPVYGANERAIEGNPKKDYRYIRITDIKDDGSLNNDWKTATNVEEKYILKEGDFLFARSGATAGKTFLYKNKHGKALYAGYLIKFPVKSNILSSSFLNFILKSNIYQNWVLSMRSGTAQPNINAKQYSSFEIPIPSLPEQQKIVSEIEKIEAKIAKAQTVLNEIPFLKNEVLKKYL